MTYPKKTTAYFSRLKEVEVPPKFTYEFLENVMLFKSNNDRYLVPLLKKMGFLSADGAPTSLYSNYRNEVESKKVLGQGIKNAYSELFRRNKNLHELTEEQINGYVKSITGMGDQSSTLPLITKTLTALVSIAEFLDKDETEKTIDTEESSEKLDSESDSPLLKSPLGLNYTISINLPETTNEEVYDKIFKSIKKTLLSK